MSVLNLPRLNFSGQVLWNPDTANNSPGVYNEITLQQNPDIPPATFVEWLESLSKNPPPGQAALNGSWNTYGDGGCWFRDTTIGGVQLAYGESNSDDPICGSVLRMVGQSFNPNLEFPPARMVDVAPYQSSTTQIFFQSLQLGDGTLGFKAAGASRMYLRWSMLRNTSADLQIAGPGSVIFQTSAKAADIEWYGVERSPALQALQQAANARPNQGITVQFTVYLTQYYKNASFNGKPITNAAELAEAYANGFTGGNPAQSEATGTIGVWGPNELATAPTQIILIPAAPVAPLAPVLPAARAVQEGMIAAPAPPPQPVPLGPAIVSLDAAASNLAVSFITTILENDLQATKMNFGPLELQAVDSSGAATTIATIPYSSYDKDAYRRTSGILDFPLTPEQLQLIQAAGTTLQLNVPDAAAGPAGVALKQTALVAETDQRGVYLDQGDKTTMTVAVYENGVPAGDNVLVLVNQYYEAPLDTSNQFPYYLVTPENQGQACLNIGAPGNANPIVLQVTNGTISFPVTPLSPGTAMLGFQPFYAGTTPPAPLPGGPNNFPGPQAANFYAVVRCLGFDNQMFDIADDQVNWTNTYNMVLQPYVLVYPKMALILDLSDENVVNSAAKQILEVTDYPRNFMWTLFMPVTREMSAGKRSLLRRYLTKVLGEGTA